MRQSNKPVYIFISVLAILVAALLSTETSAQNPEIWYKPNIPLGVAKGNFPGRVAWGHNPKVASWDGTTGFWWDDKFNSQKETDKLFAQTLFTLTEKQNEKEAWNALFNYFNHTKRNQGRGYLTGDRKSTRLNSSHSDRSRMPSSA